MKNTQPICYIRERGVPGWTPVFVFFACFIYQGVLGTRLQSRLATGRVLTTRRVLTARRVLTTCTCRIYNRQFPWQGVACCFAYIRKRVILYLFVLGIFAFLGGFIGGPPPIERPSL